jgi:hypothetical protein
MPTTIVYVNINVSANGQLALSNCIVALTISCKLYMESFEQEAGALSTLQMLEERLNRLEFLLHGSSSAVGMPDPAPIPTTSDDTVRARLVSLERAVHRLSSEHDIVRDVLKACMKKPSLPRSVIPTASAMKANWTQRWAVSGTICARGRRADTSEPRHSHHHGNRSRACVYILRCLVRPFFGQGSCCATCIGIGRVGWSAAKTGWSERDTREADR